MLVLCLLPGDVSVNKLLQHPAVVDVSAATGTQRPVSLSDTKTNPVFKLFQTELYIDTLLCCLMYHNTHLFLM